MRQRFKYQRLRHRHVRVEPPAAYGIQQGTDGIDDGVGRELVGVCQGLSQSFRKTSVEAVTVERQLEVAGESQFLFKLGHDLGTGNA